MSERRVSGDRLFYFFPSSFSFFFSSAYFIEILRIEDRRFSTKSKYRGAVR